MTNLLTKVFDRPKRLSIGSEAPGFTAKSTPYNTNGQRLSGGGFNFHSYINGKWAVLFSHPCDFTPVCTTEIASFAEKQEEFDKRDTKLVGISVGSIQNHREWITGIHTNVLNTRWIHFPIVADEKGAVARLYDMLDKEETLTDEDVTECQAKLHTIRSVFIINPEKKIRVILTYPMETGRNIDEIIRIIDSLQVHEDQGVHMVTPANWQPGDDVLFRPTDTKKINGRWSDVIDKYNLPYIKFKPLAKDQLRAFRKNR